MFIVSSENHRAHSTETFALPGDPYQPTEVRLRADRIHEALEGLTWCQFVPPEDWGLAPLEAVHSGAYLSFLQEASASGQGVEELLHPYTFAPRHAVRIPQGLAGRMGWYGFGAYTPILPGTWEAAYWSAQIALTGANLLDRGESLVYGLCRPPGHHAAEDLFGGYCYLNNAAVAARDLQRREGGCRISILDIDYHHGNGTQLIFYRDPTVQYCSLHAHPDHEYPYFWGDRDERGEGEGEGTNHNWPLPPETGDPLYLETLERALRSIEDFNPRYLILSAGVDILRGDPEGGFVVSLEGLQEIGHLVGGLNRKILVLQEGGYLLDSLGEATTRLLEGLR